MFYMVKRYNLSHRIYAKSAETFCRAVRCAHMFEHRVLDVLNSLSNTTLGQVPLPNRCLIPAELLTYHFPHIVLSTVHMYSVCVLSM